MDMWTVNTLPTRKIPRSLHISENELLQDEEKQRDYLPGFLQRNFDVVTIPQSHSFIQRAARGDIYVSTWNRGEYIHIANQHISQSPNGFSGVNTISFNRDHECVYSSDGDKMAAEYVHDRLLPLIVKVNNVFNQALGGVFEYKHDFIQHGWMKYTLIQSRVASRMSSLNEENGQRQAIRDMVTNGVPMVNVDVKKLDKLETFVPKGPYVINLANKSYAETISSVDLLTLDLRGMVGLRLPEYLRGGLLQHCGYNVIAYALYWGIPITIG